MTLHLLETWRKTSTGAMRRLRDGFERGGSTPPPPPPSPEPWFGHIDQRDRGAPHPGTGFVPFDAFLKDSLVRRGKAAPSGAVGQFIHGYSQDQLPTSFAASSVSSAPNLGVGAMLNTKRPWAGLANGTYDADIRSLFNSWPVGTFGEVTINHEPENDSPGGNNAPSDPTWVTWANANAPIWKAGIARFITVAAPIIRSRGLDVKVGGCLMDFSWDTTSWTWWNWWDEPAVAANLDVVSFQIDIYQHYNTSGVARDITSRFNTILAEARSVGIPSFSCFETALNRSTSYGVGAGTIIGTDTKDAAWWDGYATFLKNTPETRMVCYFHLPTGFASCNAWLYGAGLDKYADICMAGRRGK